MYRIIVEPIAKNVNKPRRDAGANQSRVKFTLLRSDTSYLVNSSGTVNELRGVLLPRVCIGDDAEKQPQRVACACYDEQITRTEFAVKTRVCSDVVAKIRTEKRRPITANFPCVAN